MCYANFFCFWRSRLRTVTGRVPRHTLAAPTGVNSHPSPKSQTPYLRLLSPLPLVTNNTLLTTAALTDIMGQRTAPMEGRPGTMMSVGEVGGRLMERRGTRHSMPVTVSRWRVGTHRVRCVCVGVLACLYACICAAIFLRFVWNKNVLFCFCCVFRS